MEKLYKVIKNDYGMVLISGAEKFVLNISKMATGADFYLKQVEPVQKYVTGLFYNKKKMFYRGKAMNGNNVFVRVNGSCAYIRGL